MNRRAFVKLSAIAATAFRGASATGVAAEYESRTERGAVPAPTSHAFNGPYEGEHLARVAFPLGGIGAGMICLEGTGALSHVSLRNRPDIFNEPGVFAAIAFPGSPMSARVLEGPVPGWKLFGRPGCAAGQVSACLGLPRFRQASFRGRFPFGEVALGDPELPVEVSITGWSPFEPGDEDNSSLPVAALEYRFVNRGTAPQDAVFSFHARQFLRTDGGTTSVDPVAGGFVLRGKGSPSRTWEDAAFAAFVTEPAVKVNHAWFRGGWWDPLTMTWREIAEGAVFERPPVTDDFPAPGASLYVPFTLAPKSVRTIVLRLAWHAGRSDLRTGRDATEPSRADRETYRPWYAGQFARIEDVVSYWNARYDRLRAAAERFAGCFHSSTLPPEVMEAVAANLSILKSPTLLRQTDGRLWGWEGCNDAFGQGDLCSHVWNYAQAIPHLFPALERTLRETEFGPSQDERGQQTFRSPIPIRPIVHVEYDAADGQLGGILKLHRDWRISGDTGWLRRIWPLARRSLEHCIDTWDPRRLGRLEEPQHNTYDIEFWGPNGMCTSIYLAALQAAVVMGRALGEDVSTYAALVQRGARWTEDELFNGEYFEQKVEWRNLRAKLEPDPKGWDGRPFSPEAMAIREREGPNYQYGAGCLSDGVIGEWFARVCGVAGVLDATKVRSHLEAVHRHNLVRDLTSHANPQRPTYAAGAEGGLLLCSWPRGGRMSLPFGYSDEVWTGIEYQVASHLILMGLVAEGLEIVRTCRRRYDGRIRNPYDEYEWGHWYVRALASYALLQSLSGARYDAIDRVLHLRPAVPGDFRCFLATATGYGTVGVRDGKPFLDVAAGAIEVRELRYVPAATTATAS